MTEISEQIQHSCPVEIIVPGEKPLSDTQASELEDLFKILANDTRLKLLQHLAIAKEMCVCDLADCLSMKPQAVSNQLQKLLDRGIVASTRKGNNISYRVVDSCILELLQKAVCLLHDSGSSEVSDKS